MKVIYHLVVKEFLQILRSKFMIAVLTVMPVVQLILLSYAANNDIKDLKIGMIDRDLSPASRLLANQLQGSRFFSFKGYTFSQKEVDAGLNRNDFDAVIEVPAHFERDLVRNNKASLQILVNAIDNQKASLANAYLNSVIQDFNQNVRLSWRGPNGQLVNQIETIPVNWYNPTLDYPTLMVPGILAELLSLLTMIFTALNIVKEKELGTLEQINVTPVTKAQFIAGKLIPFWIAGHIIFWNGLTFGRLVFHIPFVGSAWLLELFIAVYLLVVLGLGLLISTIAETQQQAMFTAFFFVLSFILLCGLFTPVENMPEWAQLINIINPVAYIVKLNRLVILKGSGADVVLPMCGYMAVYAIAVNGLAIWRYKKTS